MSKTKGLLCESWSMISQFQAERAREREREQEREQEIERERERERERARETDNQIMMNDGINV